MSESFRLRLGLEAGYRFAVAFDDPVMPRLVTDEPAPLGGSAGPNPSRLLGAAVANCLAASLLFALRKFGNAPPALDVDATVSLGRNAQKRMRIEGIAVDLHVGLAGDAIAMRERILAQFEGFCIVTQSVRAAIPVTVRVFDAGGHLLYAGDPETPAAEGAAAQVPAGVQTA